MALYMLNKRIHVQVVISDLLDYFSMNKCNYRYSSITVNHLFPVTET